MSSWDEGYVSEVGYTYGYYNELNPQRMKLAFALAGLEAPDVKAAAELGFGQGMSILLHGASTGVDWHGSDFNPSQAGFARAMVQKAGLSVDVTDQSFADFCTRPDLPDFDFVGLHGIWSWVSQANRGIIVDFLRRKLKVGGVVYLSYNTYPGWSAWSPIRHLLARFDERMAVPGANVVTRVEQAMAFVEKLIDTEPLLQRLTPSIKERFELFKKQDRQYLAHEFFNQDWRPFYFTETAESLAAAKLEFACSANPIDALDALNLTDQHQDMLEGIDDRLFRETMRDMLVNQSFRKDYWVKGPRRLTDMEHGERIRATEVVLMAVRDEVPMKVKGALGDADLSPEIYDPVLKVLGDHKPHSIGALSAALPQVRFSNVLQAMFILSGLGVLGVATPTTPETRAASLRMNRAICQRARSSTDINMLASPVTGGGVPVTRFQQLFLLARQEGRRQPEDWAAFAWEILSAQNQKLIKDGQTIETEEDNLAQLRSMATAFSRVRLPMLITLGVAER